MKPIFELVYAQTLNGVIGVGNGLPWSKQKADMKHFRKLTTGGIVVMGRKTFESIGSKPLQGRINIVLSETLNTKSGILVFGSFEDLIDTIPNDEGLFIIGGSSIYQQALDLGIVKVIHRTIIHTEVSGDTHAPTIPDAFKMVNSELHQKDEQNEFTYEFQTWTK